jgi:hypothetical protein
LLAEPPYCDLHRHLVNALLRDDSHLRSGGDQKTWRAIRASRLEHPLMQVQKEQAAIPDLIDTALTSLLKNLEMTRTISLF